MILESGCSTMVVIRSLLIGKMLTVFNMVALSFSHERLACSFGARSLSICIFAATEFLNGSRELSLLLLPDEQAAWLKVSAATPPKILSINAVVTMPGVNLTAGAVNVTGISL